MSARFTHEEAAAWTGGRWSARPEREIRGAVQDNRILEPGMLYIALPGERVDGHRFIAPAFAAGAAGAVCARGRAVAGVPCLEVDDPAEALRDLARGVRGTLGVPVIGVTGSAGKTTVKDLLTAIFARRHRVCATRGNWNNAIGLPLSLLRMDAEDEAGVFEVGMNRPGEIADLAAILRPTHAVITSIGEAHLENLGTVEAIAREKASLLAALPEDGLAVLDMDGPWVSLFRGLCRCPVVGCAMEREAEVTGAVDADTPRGLRIRDRLHGHDFVVEIPVPGAHMRRNTLQAATLALACGLSPEEVRLGVEAFVPAPMRWREEAIGGRRIVNDAYNANPLSMRAALAAFAEMEGPAEDKWLVVGGMAELGADEEALHRETGRFVDRFRWGGVIGVGPRAAWMCGEVRGSRTIAVRTVDEAADRLAEEAGENARVLVKGSRSEGLERIVPLLGQRVEVNAL